MSNPNDPFAVPDWLLDAWQSAINNSKGVSTELLIAQAWANAEARKAQAGSWSFWNEASLLAIIGWREVYRRNASTSEANRTEDRDQPAGD